MLRRLKTQLKLSSNREQDDDEERLLAAIELHEYPINTIVDASTHVYDTRGPHESAAKRNFQTWHHNTLSLSQLRRAPKLENFGAYVDSLLRRLQQHSRDQWVIVHDSEELGFRDQVRTSSERLLRIGRRRGHPRRRRPRSGSDTGLRSSVKWYFGSPAEIVKDCPTLEFVRIHLAPPNVWL
ncbi:hypothetical protein IMSHALPRED_009840 [Imshaugia aleurites]|uniref:Uncharacterized protein n=1 Tax=Imshaugia aleurites TaxID=172621 RepID=A0A8H3INT8_9LECA|nr:hypothetical protein IMSHALPRED_009840 [Imshaugia aleurites]